MKRIVILTLLVVMVSACGQVTETPNTTTNQVLPTATDLLAESPTLETTDIPEPVATQEDLIQNTETPIFTKSSQSLGDTRSQGLAVADVDMDNDVDIFYSNYIGDPILWVNDGDGNFSSSGQSFGPSNSEIHDVEIADLNGDSFPDIFTVSHAGGNRIFFNDGTGMFTESEQVISDTEYPSWILLGDVDVDGDVDAIIIYARSPNLLWLNDGSGFFTLSDTGYGGDSAIKMSLADFNGDTFLDLFHIKFNAPGDVWFNDGSGNFTESGQSIGGEIGDDDSAIGDIDGDGDQDIITSSPDSGYFKVWQNQDATGVFEEIETYIEPLVRGVHLVDADFDGDLDLITMTFDNVNKLWLNDGLGEFTSMGELFDNKMVLSIEVADFDGDGDDDVAFGYLEGSGGNRIFWNE